MQTCLKKTTTTHQQTSITPKQPNKLKKDLLMELQSCWKTELFTFEPNSPQWHYSPEESMSKNGQCKWLTVIFTELNISANKLQATFISCIPCGVKWCYPSLLFKATKYPTFLSFNLWLNQKYDNFINWYTSDQESSETSESQKND